MLTFESIYIYILNSITIYDIMIIYDADAVAQLTVCDDKTIHDNGEYQAQW